MYLMLRRVFAMITFVVFASKVPVSVGYSQCAFEPRAPSWLQRTPDLPLVIGGLVAKTGHGIEIENLRFASSLWSAVNFALADIKRHPCILNGYDLLIDDKDTQCKAAKGMKILFDTMSSKVPKLALFGAACTSVNEPVAMTAKYFHMVQVSYTETHPKFAADKETYSFFYPVVPTFRNVHLARVHLLNHFNWSRVGIAVQRDDARYALPQEEVQNALITKYSKEVAVSVGFSATKLNIRKELEILKKHDARIILGFFNSSIASEVFCEAWKQGLVGPNYAWIVSNYFDEHWWKKGSSNCTVDELMSILNGHFMLSFSVLRSDSEITINGNTAEEFQTRFFNSCESDDCRDFHYHGYIYDGIWTLALAMNRIVVEHAISKGQKFDTEMLDHQQMQPEWGLRLMDSLNATKFEGVTGPVRFEGNQRMGLIRIAQFQNGTYVSVGEYDGANDHFAMLDEMIKWRGSGPPSDRINKLIEKRYIDYAIFCVMSAMTAVGIVVAVWFLVVNIYFRNHRFIKMSSPNMNNLIVVGSILTYISVVLIGLDTRTISEDAFGTAKVWTLCFGFTLAFGSMFSKTWRVHSIFTNIKLNKKAIKDSKLFLIVFVLLFIDLLILTVWICIERMTWRANPLPFETFLDKNLRIEPIAELCHSDYTMVFQVLLFSFKGLQLISGCFLAWETRHVNVPALNDSKYIGACVYNVVVMCSLGVPISFILKDNINASYILISIFIIFCTTLTLCLVFIPKVVELARNPKGSAAADKRFRQTMMKSSNQRPERQMSSGSLEDRKERLIRTQQDNVIWKKMLDDRIAEVATLVKEIEKLGDIGDDPSRTKPVIGNDSYGGVFLGFADPSSSIMSPQSPLVEEATETTSLISRAQNSCKKENSVRQISLKRSSTTEKTMSDGEQYASVYQSLADLDEPSADENYAMNVHRSFGNSMNSTSKLRHIDSQNSEEYISTSRTMPSIKESCFSSFTGYFDVKKSSSNKSFESTLSRVAETDDEYRSAYGSFLRPNALANSNSWWSADDELEDFMPQSTITDDTWLTPTEETLTSNLDTSEQQSLLAPVDNNLLHIDAGTMSASTSFNSDCTFSKTQYQKMPIAAKPPQNWFEKLTNRFVASPTLSITSRCDYQRLPKYSISGGSRPVPHQLLEFKGPECPFVVRTKDFALYSKFTKEDDSEGDD